MISPQDYDRYSTPLAQQMQRISLVGPRFLEAIRAAQVSGTSQQLVTDAMTLGEELGGRPGEGALEVYRDLAANLQSTRRFIGRWQSASDAGAQRVVQAAREIQRELELMTELVSATPPQVMAEIKRTLTTAFGTDEQRYEFRGSTALMVCVFAAVLALRYFEVITLSWWIVWPLGLGAAVITAALASTIIHTRR
jgi:hypothetical protein